MQTAKEAILKVLELTAWATVSVTYNGSGDDGCTEDPVVKDSDGKEIEIKDIEINYPGERSEWSESGKCWIESERIETMSLSDALIEFTNDWVDRAGHSGYQNNEGGYGEITITRDGMKFELNHYDNVIETIHSGHEL
jgi:hypothetical protein